MNSTSIIIPAYNEEKNIEAVINEIQKNSKKQFNIIVVDDGSVDNTKEIAKRSGAIVISHENNKGYGKAISTGIMHSLELNSDIIVIIDADYQHSPNDIEKLILPLKNNQADFVIGSRFLNERQHKPFRKIQITISSLLRKFKIPLHRRVGIIVLTFLVNLLANLNITDAQSGFRAFSKDVAKDLLNLKIRKMGFSVEVLFLVSQKKYKIKEIPIVCNYMNIKHSTDFFVQGFQVFKSIISSYLNYR